MSAERWRERHGEPSAPTRATLGPFLEAVEAIAVRLDQSRAVVVRSMVAEWFERHPEAAQLAGAPVLEPAPEERDYRAAVALLEGVDFVAVGDRFRDAAQRTAAALAHHRRRG